MQNKKFATVINCIDGRVQEPVIDWLKNNFDVEYVDDITEPGPDAIVCSNIPLKLTEIKNKVKISVEKHGSHLIALAGHYDCAGNPESKEVHFQEITKGTQVIESWGFPAKVIGLWVNEAFEVEQIC